MVGAIKTYFVWQCVSML